MTLSSFSLTFSRHCKRNVEQSLKKRAFSASTFSDNNELDRIHRAVEPETYSERAKQKTEESKKEKKKKQKKKKKKISTLLQETQSCQNPERSQARRRL
jgi:sugar-specific transcriptional regulator TrmB